MNICGKQQDQVMGGAIKHWNRLNIGVDWCQGAGQLQLLSEEYWKQPNPIIGPGQPVQTQHNNDQEGGGRREGLNVSGGGGGGVGAPTKVPEC